VAAAEVCRRDVIKPLRDHAALQQEIYFIVRAIQAQLCKMRSNAK
jgi:hypothetical protein